MVVYHVGSRNEAPGNTGSAHLLEHMIFNKSTENFGKANGHKTFQEVLYEAGADFASSNMTTWYDRMNGYSTLPSDKLELAMRSRPTASAAASSSTASGSPRCRSCATNTRSARTTRAQALLQGASSPRRSRRIPYHWTTIGYRSDIEGVTTEKLREHYKTFFHPDNAEAILVGDFDAEAALALFDREFGAFPKSPQPIPQVITVEPPQEGERRVVVQRPGQRRARADRATCARARRIPTSSPLDVLASILARRRQLAALPGARRDAASRPTSAPTTTRCATRTRCSSTRRCAPGKTTRRSRRR